MLCAETRFERTSRVQAAIPNAAAARQFVGSCLICTLLTACGGPSQGPEQAVREWVAAAQAAAEEKDRRGLLSMISENYADNRGNDYERVDRTLRALFLRQKKIVVVSKIDRIEVNADTAAEVYLTAAIAGSRGSFDFDADAYRFELELEYDGDRWLLIGARWGELGEGLH